MTQSFKRIAPHLYKRQYQAANGEWRTLYYGILVDWKGKRRRFPLGSDRKTAREELKVYEARNIRREDFDKDKESEVQSITLSEWGNLFFKEKVSPDNRSVERDRRSFKTLESFFGNLPLTAINRSKVMEYKAKRSQEPIVRRGKAVMGSKIAFPTINRELAFLRSLLNLALDDGLLETVPRMKLQSEKGRKRKRIAFEEEYQALLGSMSRPAQRVLIGLYESAMRVNEVLRLPWEMVDEKARMIRLPDWFLKEKAPRNILITDGLQAVLDELRMEQRKVASISNRVYTRNGRPIKSIRTAFKMATDRNGIRDLRQHDFRHTCITRWANMGIPRHIILAASGHASIQIHDGYVNVNENHLRDAFKMLTKCSHENQVDAAQDVSY